MSRKSVGYFHGIEPAFLTSLICEGYDTIPISNGFDNHGQYIRLFNMDSKVDLLMAYMHKIYAPPTFDTQAEDIFHICQTYQIPMLVIVPKKLHDCARQKFTSCPDIVQFVDPADLQETAMKILRDEK